MTAICFDFDSTVIDLETLDELIRLSLEERGDPDGAERVMREVRATTDAGMNGDIGLKESITRRLKLGNIHKRHVEQFRSTVTSHITPGMTELMGGLRKNGMDVCIVSGGFRECIDPVADLMGFPEDRVFANSFLFDKDGNVTGIGGDSPLAENGGKSALLRRIRARMNGGTIVMVGDGMTDLETVRDGAADLFIGFGAHQVRPHVRDAATHYCLTCDALSSLLLSPPRP